MKYRVYNFTPNENDKDGNPNVKVIQRVGPFSVAEFQRDLSVNAYNAQNAYFCKEMNVKPRQLVCDLSETSGVTLQRGAMQWTVGNVNATTGVKGVGDLIGKAFRGSVTKESVVKPEYVGDGLLVTEATYKHLILIDVGDWKGQIVMDDGMFLASEASLKHSLVMRSNISSAIAGGKGLFNLALSGSGVACLESPVPYQELVEVWLKDDVLRVDGNMAMVWSASLEFSVERSGKTLIGSAASGEGLVNVYRGTGKVLMAPLRGSLMSGGAAVSV